MDENGKILADAELILVEKKIAIAPTSLEAKNVLQAAGFTIYTIEEVETISL